MDRRLTALAAGVVTAAVAACGSAGPSPSHEPAGIPARLLREARPIGVGPRFHPPARGPVIGRCRAGLGRRAAVHVEVFAADRGVLIAAGIGVRAPVRRSAGRIVAARCYGDLVTVEPTGVVLLAPGARYTLGDLFRSWGQPLSAHRAGPFAAPRARPVRVYVGGRPRGGDPARAALQPHGEVVVEVGPYVPPHTTYTFPPGT